MANVSCIRGTAVALLSLTIGWLGLAAQAQVALPSEPPASLNESALDVPIDAHGDAQSDAAAMVADAAVTAWLERPPALLTDLVGLDAREVCERLPELVAAPPAPAGTRVNLEDRRRLESDEPDRLRFSYAAVRPNDQLDVVVVELVPDGDSWRAESVGFRVEALDRSWLAAPAAGATFALLSLILLVLSLRPSPVRRALVRGIGYVREHKRLVLVTMVSLYAAFGAGVWSGAALPPECDDAVAAVLGQALGQVGATDALLAGDPLRLAVTIFYQNFGVVTLLLFWLGLLFGAPAYLMAFPQFFANGLPFGVLYAYTGPLALVGTLLLIVIELTAYFLVVAGGGMLLVSIIRKGFGGFALALRKTLAMLLIAAVLLTAGAWYEVALIALS